MKNNKTKSGQVEMKFIRCRKVFSWVLLCAFTLITLQIWAIYYRSNIRGTRGGLHSTLQTPNTADSYSTGRLCQDDEGNMIVEWPVWINGGSCLPRETVTIADYKSETDFLKVYLEKCLVRDNKPLNDKRVIGAEYERKMMYKRVGKKMWATHLKVLQATRAAEKKFLQGLPLESLFGIKIGKPVDLALYEKTETENCYVFKPARQFRKFDAYAFRVTPKSHIVYQIRAKSDAFASSEGLDEEWNYVKQVFMKKFQKKAVKELPDHNGYLLLFPGAGASVEREIVIRRAGDAASIMAVDLKLAKLAEEERTSTDAKSLVPSGNDVDAL